MNYVYIQFTASHCTDCDTPTGTHYAKISSVMLIKKISTDGTSYRIRYTCSHCDGINVNNIPERDFDEIKALIDHMNGVDYIPF